MKFIELNSALIFTAMYKYPPKLTLIILVMLLTFLGSQLPLFMKDFLPFVVPLIKGIFDPNIEPQIPLVLLSYGVLFAASLAYIGRLAFLCSIKLFNRYGIVIPT